VIYVKLYILILFTNLASIKMSDRTPVPKKLAKMISLKKPENFPIKEVKLWINAGLPSLIKPHLII